MHRRQALRSLVLAAAALTAVGLAQPSAAAEGVVRYAGAADAVAGSFVVVLDRPPGQPLSTQDTSRVANRYGATVTHTYRAALHGFSARMSAQQARRLAADPSVAYVQQDRRLRALADQPNPRSYGLDRIDQRNLPLDDNYSYATTAANVHAYVIDSGIRTTHETFGGRATWGTNTTGDGDDTDCNGHGTHVAGTIGGTEYGVAKETRLVAVKAIDCTGAGSTAGVIAAVDWVTANAAKPAVANMSLGGSPNTALESAVRNSIESGIPYVTAAGNSNSDACQFSPARIPEAVTASSTTKTDAKSTAANYGSCVDVFAPGTDILSAWNTSDTATNTLSGTSMAAAHVTGAIALYLSQHPDSTAAAAQDAINADATEGVVGEPGAGTPNRLIYTG